MPRISQLTALTTADNVDEIPILDDSATTTKKISKANFLVEVTNDIAALDVRVDALEVTTISTLLQALYPVGAIFISNSASMPALISATGTWARLKGRVIVGLDEAQAEFDGVGETGGFKTHTLTTAEIPAHQHSIHREFGTSTVNIAAPGQYNQLSNSGALDSSYTTTDGGSGGAHNNLQPYKTKYMWERTA